LVYSEAVLQMNTFAAEFSLMPVLKPCATPGCPLLIEGQGYQRPSHCEKHRRERARAFRAKRESGRGYTDRWQRVSKMVLRRSPICEICNRNPSTETDHILPKVEGGTDHPDNLQGLCKPCHSRKTGREKR